MFSVLIVDDEEPVLDSYEFMLKNYTPSPGLGPSSGEERTFVLAGKARSGYEALSLIHEKTPDIVFMDNNIPGIDGLSVIEDVYKKFPRTVFIVSTAYERFDLAQRAVPLGIFAYLVKPISKRTFYDILERALDELASRPVGDVRGGDRKTEFFRKDIWAAMSEETWGRYRQELGLPSDKGMAVIVQLEKDQEKLCALAAERFSYRHFCLYDLMLSRCIFLLSENLDLNGENAKRHIGEILEEVFAGEPPWYWGAGGVYGGPELYKSCAEALAELEKRRNEADTGLRERLRIKELRQKIGIEAPEEVRALFTGIWETAFAGDFELGKIKRASVFTRLLDDITGALGAAAEEKPLCRPAVEIAKLPDIGAWKQWAAINFDKLLLKAGERRAGNFPQALVKALAFIQGHYGEGIQLGDAAEYAMVTPAHLSRLFSEHLKTNFIDYITALRIDEAERLLKETAMTIKDVAFAAGYQDPNYFSKIFKKITGKLPTEVREK
jgi:two-component system response regulator YesN